MYNKQVGVDLRAGGGGGDGGGGVANGELTKRELNMN